MLKAKKDDLDAVASEHELANNNTTNTTGGTNNKNSCILSTRDSKLTHRPSLSDEEALISGAVGSGYLAQLRELTPHLIKYLSRLPPEPHRVHLIKPSYH